MNNGGLARLRYYRGQMLTARDFEDQQDYHRKKQRLLLRRFPSGIIQGLEVTFKERDQKDPADVDSFLIGEGLAVDVEGNELVVPKDGLKAPVSGFDPDAGKRFLSLVYDEGHDFVGGDLCGDVQKSNRIREGVRAVWDTAANVDGQNGETSHVTVALIQFSETEEEKASGVFRNPMKPKLGAADPPVRKEARVVDTEQLSDFAVTEPKLANEAVTDKKLADDAVTETKLKNSAVTDAKLADNAVVRVKIRDAAVNEDKLDNNAVTNVKLADNAVTTAKLDNNAVTAEKILDASITDAELQDGAVVEAKIRNENVTAAKLATDSVITVKILDRNVTTQKLADNAVNAAKLADGAVVGAKIPDASIAATKLAPLSITADRIGNENVTADKLAPNAVTNVKLANDAVTGPKILNGSVTRAKLAPDALVAPELADRAVTEAKLADNAVTNPKLAQGAVTETKLAPNAVSNTKITDRAVGPSKLNVVRQLMPGSVLGPGVTTEMQTPPVSQHSLLHVVPTTNGRLSWTFTVQGSTPDGMLTYAIRVVNPGPAEVRFDVREIQFHVGPLAAA